MSISTEDKPPLLNRCLPYLSPRCNPPTQSKKIVVIIYEGSLKNNIERIAKQHGWCKVIWQAPADYHWVGTAKITGNSLPEVIELVLRPFPLEITFYQANRIAAVTPRKYYD